MDVSNDSPDLVDGSDRPISAYEDSLEGLLQYHADRSLWLKEQARSAKTQVKRDYFDKKVAKNNQKLWKLLVRTPNAYNPLMGYLNGNSLEHVGGVEADMPSPSGEQ